jgi:hypothetical protein
VNGPPVTLVGDGTLVPCLDGKERPYLSFGLGCRRVHGESSVAQHDQRPLAQLRPQAPPALSGRGGAGGLSLQRTPDRSPGSSAHGIYEGVRTHTPICHLIGGVGVAVCLSAIAPASDRLPSIFGYQSPTVVMEVATQVIRPLCNRGQSRGHGYPVDGARASS